MNCVADDIHRRPLADPLRDRSPTGRRPSRVQAGYCLEGPGAAVRALSQSKDWRLPVAISLLMAYLGLVPSERSTGEQVRRGSITKAGNPRPARSAAFRGLLATSSNPAHAFHFFQLASNSALAWSSVATPLSARSPAACWERKAPRTSSDRRARLFAHTKSSNCRAGRRALRSVTRPSRAHK
jgi:hypothetical protein